jgi:hypothetical protein
VRTPEQIHEERRLLREQYKGLYDGVSALLFRRDPIGINFEDNTDEYEAEVGTILPRLNECHSSLDVLRVVHEEFVRWFDSGTAGPREAYEEIASEVWILWQEFLTGTGKTTGDTER